VNKAWNLHPEKKPELFQETGPLQSIFSGWKRHLKVDQYFHSSAFFAEHTHRIKGAVLPLELLLDSLLITDNVLDAHDFYNHLKSADRDSLDDFLGKNHIGETSKFFKFFDEFNKVSYLHSYNEAKSLVYALNKICMRLWPDPLTENQKQDLQEILIDYKEYLRSDYIQIFEDISDRLI